MLELAQVAAQLDASKATLAQVDRAMVVLDRNVRSQARALASSKRALQRADAHTRDLNKATKAGVRRVVGLRAEMRRRAVANYVHADDSVLEAVVSQDYAGASKRRVFGRLRAETDLRVLARLRSSQASLRHRRSVAATAGRSATAQRARHAARLKASSVAVEQQRRLSEGIQANITLQLEHSIKIKDADRAQAARIATLQAALQARLLAGRQLIQDQLNSGSLSASGAETGPQAVGAGPEGSRLGIILCNVGGITVNCLISNQVADMLQAARTDGLVLTGGGYRGPSAQVQLRRDHCGSSYEQVYLVSPEACHPPTARPGSSMHEVGFAIDFDGCSSRQSAVYAWLSAHAASFGLYNLPSEPWHWSVTGQ